MLPVSYNMDIRKEASCILSYNEEFSGRASMGTATHGAFAEMPWPFAYAEMLG
jgi:hypothetical protein